MQAAAKLVESVAGVEEEAQLAGAVGRCAVFLDQEGGALRQGIVTLNAAGDRADHLQLRQLLLQMHRDGLLVKVLDPPGQEIPMTATLDMSIMKRIRKLTGLDCNQDPDLLPLVQLLGPRLEELQLRSAGREALAAVEALPALRRLDLHVCPRASVPKGCWPALPPHLEALRIQHASPEQLAMLAGLASLRRLDVASRDTDDEAPPLPEQLEELRLHRGSTRQLASVGRMPRLRRLELRGYEGGAVAFLPPLADAGCGLQALAVLVEARHEDTVLSLLRAHARTLHELQIRCDSVAGASCHYPSLSAALARCGLRALRRLVLLRTIPRAGRAAHPDSCRTQVDELRAALAGPGATLRVLCSECDQRELIDSVLSSPFFKDKPQSPQCILSDTPSIKARCFLEPK